MREGYSVWAFLVRGKTGKCQEGDMIGVYEIMHDAEKVVSSLSHTARIWECFCCTWMLLVGFP